MHKIKLIDGHTIEIQFISEKEATLKLTSADWKLYRKESDFCMIYIHSKGKIMQISFEDGSGFLCKNLTEWEKIWAKAVIFQKENPRELGHFLLLDAQELVFLYQNCNPIKIDQTETTTLFLLDNQNLLRADTLNRDANLFENKTDYQYFVNKYEMDMWAVAVG
jgi:hypothetical protein